MRGSCRRTRRDRSLARGLFFFVTARNLALNHLRHQRIERPDGAAEIDALSVADERVGAPEALAHAEEFQILIRAIESLPERCRQVVTLRKIYGLSQRSGRASRHFGAYG